MGKNPTTMQETGVQSLGWGDSLEEGMATYSSILAWRIPWTGEPGRIQSIGVAKSQTRLSSLAWMHASPREKCIQIHLWIFWVWWVFENVLNDGVLVTQLCPTLCNPMDCSLPGFSVHGILQARILEWVTISFYKWVAISFPNDVYWN